MKVTGLISIQGEVSIQTKQEGTYRNRPVFETLARQIAKWGPQQLLAAVSTKSQEPQEADSRRRRTTINKVAAAAKHVFFILGNKLIVVVLLSACRRVQDGGSFKSVSDMSHFIK